MSKSVLSGSLLSYPRVASSVGGGPATSLHKVGGGGGSERDALYVVPPVLHGHTPLLADRNTEASGSSRNRVIARAVTDFYVIFCATCLNHLSFFMACNL